jgi:PPK2 family polyphosphate:nucleotide phosphotransferase
MKLSHIAQRFRIDKPEQFRLADHACTDLCGLTLDKDGGHDFLREGVERLSALQEKLYADGRYAVLVVLQGMDAAGKDSVIKHVFTGVNPQGVEVHSFKEPSAEELQHDFLWRIEKRLPEKGRIGIFNRSQYEDVLVVRVHPELLKKRRSPPAGNNIWAERFEQIRNFERRVAKGGTRILKFFLNVSKEEQRKRFLARIDEPAKRWKFSMRDVSERELWPKYMDAYEDMIRHTGTSEAPWYVIPSDHKWFARLAVAAVLVEELEALGLEFPKVTGDKLKELEDVRKKLSAEKP